MCERNNQFKAFVLLVIEAFDSIPQEYYRIKTTYDNSGIVRERVFCYELYHRIRCLQEVKGLTKFSVHGEIDKRGHGLFESDDQKNPDFVFHIPGTMEGNLVVVEVKGELSTAGIRKDWKTLSNFCSKYNYGQGLWIIYNYTLADIRNYIQSQIICAYEKGLGKTKVVCKKMADFPLETSCLSSLFQESEVPLCQP